MHRDIIPIGSSLTPKVGETVDWRFAAVSAANQPTNLNNDTVVYNLMINPLPFGILTTGAGPSVRAYGKVLGDQFRFGQIVVTSRDLKSCHETEHHNLQDAAKTAHDLGKREGIVSVLNCDDLQKSAPGFDHYHEFTWWLADAPEATDISVAIKSLKDHIVSGAGKLLESYKHRLKTLDSANFVRELAYDKGPLSGPLASSSCDFLTVFSACRDQAPKCAWSLGRCSERSLLP